MTYINNNKSNTLSYFNLKDWFKYSFYLKTEAILTDQIYAASIRNFWSQIVEKTNKSDNNNQDYHLKLIIKVMVGKTSTQRLVSPFMSLPTTDVGLKYVIDTVQGRINALNNDYHDPEITEIIFSYGFRPGIVKPHELPFLGVKPWVPHHLSHKVKLPIVSPDGVISNFGRIEDVTDFGNGHMKYIIFMDNKMAILQNFNKERTEIKLIIKNGEMNLVDSLVKDPNNPTVHFTRVHGNTTYYFDKECNLLYSKLLKKQEEFITKKKADITINDSFAVLNCKSYLGHNLNFDSDQVSQNSLDLIPYVVSTFDGHLAQNYFITDYLNKDKMLQAVIIDLANRALQLKNRNLLVYSHNLAKMGAIFLISQLIYLGEMTPIINEGNIIMLTFKYKFKDGRVATLKFFDSYQLLPFELQELAKVFNSKDLQYSNFDTAQINSSNLTQFREVSISHSAIEALILYAIIKSFIYLIWDLFKVNAVKYPTIASLALGIYRTLYMPENTIPKLSGEIYEFIKLSYLGGAVDILNPIHNEDLNFPVGTQEFSDAHNLWIYDYNSLYPYLMFNSEYPVGDINHVVIYADNYIPEEPGFFAVNVTVPKDIEPILPVKHNDKTLFATGKFSGVYFTEEIKAAQKLGCKFEFISGYTFTKSENLFKDYVGTLYNLRIQYEKATPLNVIAKLLLNSLYGKFGMKDRYTHTKIFTQSKFNSYVKLQQDKRAKILDFTPITLPDNKNVFMVELLSTDSSQLRGYKNNSNIAIASSITSQARITLSKFKNHPGIKLTYFDTDSLFINKSPHQLNQLMPGIVNENLLGKLKLEGIAKRAIFIAPKAYALLMEDGSLKVKIKGLSKQSITNAINSGILTFDSLLNVLHKDPQPLKINTKKMTRSIEESAIILHDTCYNIKINDNKRQLIYNAEGFITKTLPHHLDNKPFPQPVILKHQQEQDSIILTKDIIKSLKK